MARAAGMFPIFRMIGSAFGGGITWVMRWRVRGGKRRGSVPATPSKAPTRAQPVERRRFTESLEPRKMLAATAPIEFHTAQFYGQVPAGGVTVGNFVNGGLPDLVSISGSDDVARILINNGDGTFHGGQSFYAPSARAAAVGNFFGDGNQDLAVACNTDVVSNNNGDISTIYLFRGNGDGTFQTPPVPIFLNYPLAYLVAADLNGDGFSDLIASAATRIDVLINRGNGTFNPTVSYVAGPRASGQSVVGDFNGDGVPDIAVVRQNAEGIAVLLGQKNPDGIPTGTFGNPTVYKTGGTPRAIAIGDFTGNGIEDIAVTNFDFHTEAYSVLPGNGDGTFGKAQNFFGGNFIDGIAAGDFNGDGLIDVATVSFTSFLRAYAGNGNDTFQPFHQFDDSSYGNVVVSADFNGDGLDDVAVATGGGIRVLLAVNPTSTPVAPTSLDVTIGSGAQRSITYRDVSGYTARISLAGPGAATIEFQGANLSVNDAGTALIGGSASVTSIVGTGTTTASALVISPQGNNAVVNIGAISTDGSFKSIIGLGTNLSGDLTIPGTIGSISLNQISGGVITFGSGAAPVNIYFSNATNETLDSSQPIDSLTVGQWSVSGSGTSSITAPSIKKLFAINQLSADLTVGTGGLGSVRTYNITGGTWNIAGPIGSIRARQNIHATISATAIGSIVAGDDILNLAVNASGNIGSIYAGSIFNSTIAAGVGPLPPGQRLPETASEFVGSAEIGTVAIRGRYPEISLANSSIAAPILGHLSLGVIQFANGGQTQGLAANSVGSLSGVDLATRRHFNLKYPTSLAPLMQDGINTADFALLVI